MQSTFNTHTALVEAVRRIQDSPRGWNGTEARDLLAYARSALTPLARKFQMEPEDAVHEAWRLWQGPGIFGTEKAWGWTRTAVKNALQRQRYAQVAMTSEQGLERQSIEDFVGYADNGLDSVEDRAGDEIVVTPAIQFNSPAFLAAEAVLIKAGWDTVTARAAIEAVADLGATSATPRGAYDKVTREMALPAVLGVERSAWTTLCALLLGNSAGDLGLVEAGLLGVDAGSVKNIRNASARLARLAA